jgi:FkbM family methyltransferase
MNIIKRAIRGIVRGTGFDIVRFDAGRFGVNPFADMQHFLKGQESPVIFDVGANIGQSVDAFRNLFSESIIHSFEPSPSTYEQLKTHCKHASGVKTWNCGVGSINNTLTLSENVHSDMSSFLLPSATAWGKIARSTDVQVVTLDSFARDQKIDFIHVLKSDTQGYDFEVFKGASQLMMENRIGLIYFEFIFSDMYKDLPAFDDVFRYLSDRNFALVAFYQQHFQHDLVSWTDALFISREFNRKRVEQAVAHGAAACVKL